MAAATGKDIARALRTAYWVMHRQTQWLLSRYGMTAEQYVLLAHLSLEDGLTQKELTLRAASDPSTVRAMLILMEDKGLVIRKPDESDRRARRVLLTAQGRHVFGKLAEVLKPLQDALLAPFDRQEARQAVTYLKRIETAMRQWEWALEPAAHAD